LVLLDALRHGKRAILIEPLRALANEQAEELSRIVSGCGDSLGTSIRTSVSTGDYRIQAEEYSDPAPGAELVVCTPERLDAILRNPDNQPWIDSIGAVCLDEAHLIANPRRGPTQEFIITSLLSQPAPPRIVLLSATLGDLGQAKEWLAPCDVFQVTERYPPLRKEVVEVNEGQSANEALTDWLSSVLPEAGTQALVFVYQTRSTVKLAEELTAALGPLAGPNGAVAYHGQMSSAQRESARNCFLDGGSRVVVTTSALAMGVNLPATHLVVRDLRYPGAASPEVSDLLQMMGRAGRGDTEGHAVAILSPKDDWTAPALRQALAEEKMPDFRSAFRVDGHSNGQTLPAATPLVASLLSRAGDDGQSRADLEAFMARSLGGRTLVAEVNPALQWLADHALAYESDGQFRLTVLGGRAVRSVLPLPLAAGLGQLLRDLLSADEADRCVGTWQELDHLLVLHMLYDGTPSLRRFSRALTEAVTSWCEGHADRSPILYREWLRGEENFSKASEVTGSLGLRAPAATGDGAEWARQQGYMATFRAIVLFERGQGRSVEDLERQYGIKNLEGIEESWRDSMLWLLAGVAQMLEIRSFYYHLREECNADQARIKRVKRLLARMRHQAYDLQEKLKYCSPLGPALRDIRRFSGGGVGVETIRKLESAGITDLIALNALGIPGLRSLGVRRDIAKRIQGYLRRRQA